MMGRKNSLRRTLSALWEYGRRQQLANKLQVQLRPTGGVTASLVADWPCTTCT